MYTEKITYEQQYKEQKVKLDELSVQVSKYGNKQNIDNLREIVLESYKMLR